MPDYWVQIRITADDLDECVDTVRSWNLTPGVVVASITGAPEHLEGLPVEVPDDGDLGRAFEERGDG